MNKEELKARYSADIVSDDGKLYILPLSSKEYQLYPIRQNGNLLDGVIEITEEEYIGIQKCKLMFCDTLDGVIPYALTEAELAAKAAAEQEAMQQRKIADIQAKLAELDYDINACMDGVVKSKTEAEYRAERTELRNELRLLKGKAALTVAMEVTHEN